MSDRDWRYWWSLPGPEGFVRTLTEDLRRGANLVVALPRWAPEGLAQAVATELRDDDLLRWRPLALEGMPQDDPLGLLVRRYAPDVPERELRDPADLVESTAFSGNLVWITGLKEEAWTAWRSLLQRYADTVRRRPAEDRALICLVVTGFPPEALPREEPALSVRLWRDTITELDMLAWLHYLMGRRKTHGVLQRRLQVRHALELVAYDAHLACQAASQPLEDLASPAAWLAGVAEARGWTAKNAVCWEEGTCDSMEGQEVRHPAYLAVTDGAKGQLGSLVWRAQVGVLFPYLEEARNHYLREYGTLLKVPYQTDYGAVIQHRQELELSHIHHQLRRRGGSNNLDRLRLLREVRNALAHHQPLEPDLLREVVGRG